MMLKRCHSEEDKDQDGRGASSAKSFSRRCDQVLFGRACDVGRGRGGKGKGSERRVILTEMRASLIWRACHVKEVYMKVGGEIWEPREASTSVRESVTGDWSAPCVRVLCVSSVDVWTEHIMLTARNLEGVKPQLQGCVRERS